MQDDLFREWFGFAEPDFAGSEGRLGNCHDQTFYAVRYQPGNELKIPFPAERFNALINLKAAPGEEAMKEVAMRLLEHGMCAAVINGDEAGKMGELIDNLIDEHDFNHDGRTVYTSCHEDEEIEEVMDYFVLPNGLAEIGLIVVFGEQGDFGEAVDSFNNIAEGVEIHEMALC